jgi:transporter family-2 protein
VSQPLSLCFALAIGALVALQPPVNTAMARHLGSPLLAASLSIAISFACVVLLWLTWARGAGDFAQIAKLPPWVILGGIAGVVFVAGSIFVAPVVGVAPFFVAVVAGQLGASVLVDHVGAFGMPAKPVDATRLAGLALVLVGAALVQSRSAE